MFVSDFYESRFSAFPELINSAPLSSWIGGAARGFPIPMLCFTLLSPVSPPPRRVATAAAAATAKSIGRGNGRMCQAQAPTPTFAPGPTSTLSDRQYTIFATSRVLSRKKDTSTSWCGATFDGRYSPSPRYTYATVEFLQFKFPSISSLRLRCKIEVRT